MGREQTVESAIPSFAVEFAALDRDQPIGSQIEWAAELCKTPENESIPKLDDRPSTFRLPGGGVFQMPNLSITSFHDRLNEDYYADFASYLFVHRLFRQVRLVVTNTGEASANEVRLEIHVPNGLGVGIVYDSEIPKKPKKRENYLAMSRFNELDIRPVRHRSGCVEIEKNSHETKLEIECGLLQPGRRVWTDAFWIGIGQSGEVRLAGRLYAANLPQPREFTLSINATVGRTTLSVEDLIALGDQDFEMDEEQPEES
jgi:hypothetical protein